MLFLKNPHLPLSTSRLETLRCVLVPFSTDGRVDIHELQEEYCKANKDLYISPHLPTYEEEVAWLTDMEQKIEKRELFENFILERSSDRLLWCGGLRILESSELNIGIWIREDEHGKGYASEVYEALISWAREHTTYSYLVHSVHPSNEASHKLARKFGWVLQDQKNEREYDIYNLHL